MWNLIERSLQLRENAAKRQSVHGRRSLDASSRHRDEVCEDADVTIHEQSELRRSLGDALNNGAFIHLFSPPRTEDRSVAVVVSGCVLTTNCAVFTRPSLNAVMSPSILKYIELPAQTSQIPSHPIPAQFVHV